MDEKAGPSEENTMSGVYPDRQVMAPDLRLRTKEVRLAGEYIPIWQDEKERDLELRL